MAALQKAITGEKTLSPAKSRVRATKNTSSDNKGSSNVNNYDTDDQTDQMMDMLVKSATANDKKTRIRKNRARDSKSTRKSGY